MPDELAGFADGTKWPVGLNEIADDLCDAPAPAQRGTDLKVMGDTERGASGSSIRGPHRKQIEEALLHFFQLRIEPEVRCAELGFKHAILITELRVFGHFYVRHAWDSRRK